MPLRLRAIIFYFENTNEECLSAIPSMYLFETFPHENYR
jgi:hypothetical protein